MSTRVMEELYPWDIEETRKVNKDMKLPRLQHQASFARSLCMLA